MMKTGLTTDDVGEGLMDESTHVFRISFSPTSNRALHRDMMMRAITLTIKCVTECNGISEKLPWLLNRVPGIRAIMRHAIHAAIKMAFIYGGSLRQIADHIHNAWFTPIGASPGPLDDKILFVSDNLFKESGKPLT